MKGRYVVVMVVVFSVCIGTVFAKERTGYVTAVDREKGTMSLRTGKEVVVFEYVPGSLKLGVPKNCYVIVEYSDEGDKKKVTAINVADCGC